MNEQDQPLQGEGIAPDAQPSKTTGIHLPPKKILWVGIAVAAIIVMGVVVWMTLINKPPASQQSYNGPVDDIAIGNVGEYSIFNLIALNKGYFKQNGLNAKITEYASGPPAVADLVAKKNDFAVAADFSGVNSIFSNTDVRILTQLSQQFSFSIVARKDKGIAKPLDLKGKRIGVTKNGAGEFFLARYLNLQGLSTSSVKEIDLTPPDMNTQIRNGQLDAVVIFEPHVYNLSKDLADDVVVWSAQGGDPTLALAYTTQDIIKTKPDVVRRYIKSLVQAQEYLKQNQQDSKKLLADIMHYDTAYVNYIWNKIDFQLALNQNLLSAMEDEARFVVQTTGSNKPIPNYLDYIYFDALTQEGSDLVHIIH